MADSMSPVGQMRMAEQRIKFDALRRLREATPVERGVLGEKLREDALRAGATPDELSDAQSQPS